MNKDVVHIYNGILLSHKKECNGAICNDTDATRDYHTKHSKSERERQIPYVITCLWNLKYDTNKPIYKRETDSQTRRTDYGCQGGGGWGKDGEGGRG